MKTCQILIVKNFSEFLLIIIFLFISSNIHVYPQSRIYGSNTKTIFTFDILDCAKKENITYKGYTFFPLSINYSQNAIKKAVLPNNSDKSGNFKNKASYNLLLDIPQNFDVNNLFLNVNYYSENVSNFNIEIIDDKEERYNKVIDVDLENYSGSQIIPLKQWFSSNDSVKISSIVINVISKINKKKSKFALGELNIGRFEVTEIPAKGYFFYELTKKMVNNDSTYTISDFGDVYPIKEFTIFRDIQSRNYKFYSEFKDSIKTQDYVLSLLKSIVKKYPYYQERNINKHFVLTKIDSILNTSYSFLDKLNCIDSVISSFGDKHFRFVNAGDSNRKLPVHIKEINGDFRVVGIFDTTLLNKVSLDDRLLKINNILLKEGNRTDNDVVKMLTENVGDSLQFTIVDKIGDVKEVNIKLNNQFSIPPNFIPKHATFKIYDNAVYFRFNNWDTRVWTTFFNQYSNLKENKSIIIDLRGNSGGSEVEAYQILSCFINANVPATNSLFVFDNGNKAISTNIITPNKHLNLKNKDIYILVDRNTACASEIFIALMKKYANAIVVGSESSMGSYSSAEYFYLPLNVTMRVNILSQFNIPHTESIEFKGIEPDIYIPIYSYKDLYPYNDKILNYTIYLTTINFKNYEQQNQNQRFN